MASTHAGYRRTGSQTVFGVLAWLGWTALAIHFSTACLYILALVGVLAWPLQDSDTGNILLWLLVFLSPVAGNLVLRRLLHAVARWRRGPETVRAWVFLAVAMGIATAGVLNLLWLLGVRPAGH